MNLISDEIFGNLIKLNDLRNKCDHNVQVNFDNIDHNYHLVDKVFNIEKEKDINKKLLNVAVNTLGALNNYVIKQGVKL